MSSEKSSKKAAYTGLFAALAASSCCILPIVALIAGVGGSASALSWMEPFRPYLIGIAIVAIVFTWYSYFKPRQAAACCDSDSKPKWFQSKGFLIGITLFAALAISFPYYSYIFYPDTKKEVLLVKPSSLQAVSFDVIGMTCSGCEIHIENEVNKLEGIVEVKANYTKGKTDVRYDNSKVSRDSIIAAIKRTGYKISE